MGGESREKIDVAVGEGGQGSGAHVALEVFAGRLQRFGEACFRDGAVFRVQAGVVAHQLQKIGRAGSVFRCFATEIACNGNAEGVEGPLEESVHFTVFQRVERDLARSVQERENLVVEGGGNGAWEAGHNDGHIQALTHHFLVSADKLANLGT